MHESKRLIDGLIILSAIAFPFLLGAIDAPGILLTSQNNAPAKAAVSSCLNRVNIPESEMGWTYVPTSADQLYSADNLQWLAGRLIAQNIVDASSCPAGGLGLNGYANACGTTIAQPKVIEIQNSLNQSILDQYATVGVPPVLLKQLIRTESQFWPAENVPGHFGFGHVTPIGAINALNLSPDLLAAVCAKAGTTCSANDTSVEMLFDMMVDTCPTCPNGINTAQANQSVGLLAKVVMAYCEQTAQLVFNATGWRSDLVVDYPTLWKLTLMNYNAGSTCVFDTMSAAFKRTQGPVDWPNILASINSSNCSRGAYYANEITTNDYNFPPAQ